MKASKAKLSLNIQHDFITLRTPNGNYTVSFGGDKASGLLAKHLTAFTAIADHVKAKRAAGKNVGDIMQELTNPAVLSVFWPEWDAQVVLPALTVTGYAKMADAFFAKRYPDRYEVKEIKGKYAYLQTPKGVIGFPRTDLLVA